MCIIIYAKRSFCRVHVGLLSSLALKRYDSISSYTRRKRPIKLTSKYKTIYFLSLDHNN